VAVNYLFDPFQSALILTEAGLQ